MSFYQDLRVQYGYETRPNPFFPDQLLFTGGNGTANCYLLCFISISSTNIIKALLGGIRLLPFSP